MTGCGIVTLYVQYEEKMHCKKVSDFPSPAGMGKSLTLFYIVAEVSEKERNVSLNFSL
jgi:hypothetical protein